MSPAIVRGAAAADAAGIAAIYNHYVTNTIVTFDEEPLPAEEFARRIEATLGEGMPWLVAERDGVVVGYSYATKWKARRGYRFSAEVTVYLAPDAGGQGIGSLLYTPLLDELKRMGMHTALGGIALPNDSSIALHEKLGFEKVAHFKQTGIKFGQWIDVGYWEKIL